MPKTRFKKAEYNGMWEMVDERSKGEIERLIWKKKDNAQRAIKGKKKNELRRKDTKNRF